MPSQTQIKKCGQRLRDFQASGADVDDLSEDELQGLSDAIDVVSDYRASFSRPLLSVRMSVASFAATTGYGESALVAQRLKRLPRIIAKLDRIRTMKLTTMGDIGGCRIVVPDLDALRVIQAHMERRWNGTIRDIKDYISNPKDDGYRAVHVEMRRGDRRIEVQLRTRNQHLWADTVERVSRRVGLEFKWGEGGGKTLGFLRDWAESLALQDQGMDVPQELALRLQTFIQGSDD